MVYNNQYLFQWHVNRNVIRNEKLKLQQKVPAAGVILLFTREDGYW